MPAALYTLLACTVAGAATIGYVSALVAGPAAVVVPLASASPAVAGVLKERLARRQLAGLALGLVGASLLATQG